MQVVHVNRKQSEQKWNRRNDIAYLAKFGQAIYLQKNASDTLHDTAILLYSFW